MIGEKRRKNREENGDKFWRYKQNKTLEKTILEYTNSITHAGHFKGNPKMQNGCTLGWMLQHVNSTVTRIFLIYHTEDWRL